MELEGELQVLLNEYYLPKVTVNPYYSSMAKESDDPEARTYLKEKLRQTKWLLDSLERRGSTLRRCAQAILDAQRSFFSGQTVELSPMKLSSLAETLDLHPSTVSRAVRDKYLQPSGNLSAAILFQSGGGTAGTVPSGGEAADAASLQG